MAQISKLDQDTLEEITRYAALGLQLLELPEQSAPIDVVMRIDTALRQVRQGDMGMLEEDQIIALGVLLGEQYVRAFQWHWAEVLHKGDEEGITRVLSPDCAIGNNPIGWISELVSQTRPINILSNFYSVTAGELPFAKPNDALDFF